MKVIQPDIESRIDAAEAGDKVALARLYEQAAAWIKAGNVPPEPLGGWIADRLHELASVVASHEDRKKTAAATCHAMRITRAGKAGRAPNAKTVIMDRCLAGDVLHFIQWHDLTPYQAIDAAAAYHARNGGPDLSERITQAWKRYGKNGGH